MKHIAVKLIASFWACALLSGCIEEVDPQGRTITGKQLGEAPNAFEKAVDATTSTLVGQFYYRPTATFVFDAGYPCFFLERDAMGQDIAVVGKNNQYDAWYSVSEVLGPGYAVCQLPWTYYSKWLKNCNIVIGMAGENPEPARRTGAGIARAMRAMFYMDIARMYAAEPYSLNKKAETTPLVTEKTTNEDLYNNPRKSNEEMWAFILSDLDKAEELLKGYVRPDIRKPDVSVVYGLKARAYLETQDWANAEKYAKLAQEKYTMMDEAAYTSKELGFNSPNKAWMFGVKYNEEDPNIRLNDADSSWGSVMLNESLSGCGYASNYGGLMNIDRHLFETIPTTDWRRKVFVDFALDDLSEDAQREALRTYAYKEDVKYCKQIMASAAAAQLNVGGIQLKFRNAGGVAGRENQHVGFAVWAPLMRVEEMKLIEIEAVGMQDEGKGIALLTEFAKTRDPNFVYGKHNEAYGNTATSAFQNEVWWQRRVELWGEGFATFDIKRLNKGIIRNYPRTNHTAGYRWNTTAYPKWMNLCIIETELRYNRACTNNDIPIHPQKDSEEHQF